jgi:hypothetical protein
MELLFCMAEWHGFAKLRMHTETSLAHLEDLTKEIGRLMRRFRNKTCSHFSTCELPREVASRKRQKERRQTKINSRSALNSNSKGIKPKLMNLCTYKWHSLGDYVKTIQMFGGTDSYSTQVVSRNFLVLLILDNRFSFLI